MRVMEVPRPSPVDDTVERSRKKLKLIIEENPDRYAFLSENERAVAETLLDETEDAIAREELTPEKTKELVSELDHSLDEMAHLQQLAKHLPTLEKRGESFSPRFRVNELAIKHIHEAITWLKGSHKNSKKLSATIERFHALQAPEQPIPEAEPTLEDIEKPEEHIELHEHELIPSNPFPPDLADAKFRSAMYKVVERAEVVMHNAESETNRRRFTEHRAEEYRREIEKIIRQFEQLRESNQRTPSNDPKRSGLIALSHATERDIQQTLGQINQQFPPKANAA